MIVSLNRVSHVTSINDRLLHSITLIRYWPRGNSRALRTYKNILRLGFVGRRLDRNAHVTVPEEVRAVVLACLLLYRRITAAPLRLFFSFPVGLSSHSFG